MRYVSVYNLKDNMRYAHSLFSPYGELLVSVGDKVSKESINTLLMAGYDGVYVEEPLLKKSEGKVLYEKTKNIFETLLVDTTLRKPKEAMKSGNEHALLNTIGKICSNCDLQLMDFNNYDHYTFMHSVNVCILSLTFGLALNLKENQLEELGMGALLHDIGKTFISSRTLNYPGKYSEEQMIEMQAHAKRGYEYAARYPSISRKSKLIILQHHEKIDGSGYPFGLKGDKISYYARLVSILDIYDSLTSNRVYKRALSHEEALEIILEEKESGKLDKELVERFIELL